MTTADVQLLYAYNRWANARLLDSASLLSRELLAKDLGTSYQTVFGTLRHIAWGNGSGFTDGMSGRQRVPTP